MKLTDLKAPSLFVEITRGTEKYDVPVAPLTSGDIDDITDSVPDPVPPREDAINAQGGTYKISNFQDPDYLDKAEKATKKRVRLTCVHALGLEFFGTDDMNKAVELTRQLSWEEIRRINKTASTMAEVTAEMVEAEEEKQYPLEE